MGEVTRDCWKCDICGWEWLKEGRIPSRCASSKCRSALWNRPRKSVEGRPDKGMVRVKARMSPTLDLNGNHHPLCPCILCLTAVWRSREKVIGRPRGIGAGTPGRVKGRTHKISEREREQMGEAMLRMGMRPSADGGIGMGVSASMPAVTSEADAIR